MDFYPGYRFLHVVYEDEYIQVVHALFEATGSIVVVKRAKEGPYQATEADKLFHEFRLLSRLELPNVLRPNAMLQAAPGLALVFDNIDSLTLRHFMSMRRMSTSVFLRIAAGIVAVVERLHANDVLHMNLRPDAILVHEKTLDVCLTGFSEAIVGTGAKKSPAKEGSPAYMAPERVMRGTPAVDRRSDLYSLGVTFYEMLTGALPYRANGPVEWAHAHLAHRPDDLAAAHGVPIGVSAIVMPLLAKNPEERTATAAEVRAALERLLAEDDEAEPGAPVVVRRQPQRAGASPEELPESVLAIRRMPIRQTLHQADETTYAQMLDLTTVLKASQAFMEDVEPSELVRRLLRLALQYTGTQKLIWVAFDEAGDGAVEHETTADGEGADTFATLREAVDRLGVDWVERVARGNNRFLLNDAAADPNTRDLPYVRRFGVRSVLALPVTSQGMLRAVAYFENNMAPAVFRDAETNVLRMLLSQTMYMKRLMRTAGAAEEAGFALPAGRAPLTVRELAVLSLISVGYSNKEIADQLSVTAETVKTHVKNIFVKLDVSRRAQAVMEAKKMNLL
jgi:DNA-binding CsgD family transcriptional regulator